MAFVGQVLVILVIVIHLYIMWFEMFAWTTRGPKVFRNFAKDMFEPTKAMAANQGLYNGFLAAGLIYSLFINDAGWQWNISMLFLIFVAVAGVYGAATASKKIIYVQTVPAILAMAAISF
ncbi:MAG: DUF1304 domain-containing protein [Alphaproteobacteria bacterium]|nr:DUF1304 domain-containing protein [Alphaproteobacteria bacterium]